MSEEKIFNGSFDLDIAVIGMAGRFPGANDINEFWNNLQKEWPFLALNQNDFSHIYFTKLY